MKTSFSSTLLDRIYRSIDDGETRNEDMNFYTETMRRTQNVSAFQQACLVENLMEKKANSDKKHEHDGVLFSSTSISSDSSSGFFSFSSSDTESMYCMKTKAPSCFVRPWPRPVKTRLSAAAQSDKPLETEQSTAEKIHGDFNNFKKMKQRQPISPGGRLASFINSLFTTGNTKKPKSSPSTPSLSSTLSRDQNQTSPCASASPFSRSCLSKNTPLTREKLRHGAKRTVRFSPVTVLADEDCRPCGGQNEIGKSPSRKYDREIKFQTMEKARRVEEMAREFLKEYHLNQKKNEFNSMDSRINYEEEDDDDDASSCSSSDLFELDHLVHLGNHRYEEELPVYETTHVETNRAIANGLIL
ncbi:hypothetical protein HRI_004428800 [Hibiscus trionum]|uniref:Protein BIG GRAIN 1-like B n=1 Tax=Hibiscus trionum TaxID=183268 RepID=A0A9W7J305_HIBTR|nr:hypothetical protein HRI_004428800 [Hibiscus trionum]